MFLHLFFGTLCVVTDAVSLESFDAAPSISDELVAWLDAAYPERCIQRGEAVEDAHRRAGARDVIERLQAVMAWQRSNN